MQRLGIRINDPIKEGKKGKEGNARDKEERLFGQNVGQFGIQGDKGRRGGQDAINFQKGNGLGTAFGHNERILGIARQGQGQNDKEFDGANQEKFSHFVAPINGENGLSNLGQPTHFG